MPGRPAICWTLVERKRFIVSLCVSKNSQGLSTFPSASKPNSAYSGAYCFPTPSPSAISSLVMCLPASFRAPRTTEFARFATSLSSASFRRRIWSNSPPRLLRSFAASFSNLSRTYSSTLRRSPAFLTLAVNDQLQLNSVAHSRCGRPDLESFLNQGGHYLARPVFAMSEEEAWLAGRHGRKPVQ